VERVHGTGSTGGFPEQPAAQPAGLRPFVLTSGRVDGLDREIRLETQVTARHYDPMVHRAPVSSLAPELQAIVALCDQPISVAEISARLRMHLGVTKILVGDLRAAGHLDVHITDTANSHSPETILRVMRGLRAIS
jgi:Protein of unknown function (DUF742)